MLVSTTIHHAHCLPSHSDWVLTPTPIFSPFCTSAQWVVCRSAMAMAPGSLSNRPLILSSSMLVIPLRYVCMYIRVCLALPALFYVYPCSKIRYHTTLFYIEISVSFYYKILFLFSQICDVLGFGLQAWTNGRFKSVKHRAVVNETESRLSIVYFSNPLPHSIMSVPHKLIDCEHPLEFRPAFTWLDYKTHLLETHKNHNNNNNGGRTSNSWLLRRKSILNQK